MGKWSGFIDDLDRSPASHAPKSCAAPLESVTGLGFCFVF